MQDIRTNFLPHLKKFVWRRHAGQKPTETSVTEFATKAWENHQHYNSTFSNTVQIANFHEVHHLFNKHYSSLDRRIFPDPVLKIARSWRHLRKSNRVPPQSPIAKHHRDEKRRKGQKWRRVYEWARIGDSTESWRVRTPRSGTLSCQRRDNQTTPGIGRRNRRRVGNRKRSYRWFSPASIATEEIDQT